MAQTFDHKAGRAVSRRQEEPEQSNRCAANGCPLRGHVSIAGGREVCSAHAAAAPAQWGNVSEAIRDHDWLTAFIQDLQGMADGPWVEYATRFWEEADAYMVPTPDEARYFDAYFGRVLREFLYRVGATQKRPQQWTVAATRQRNQEAGYRFVRGNV